MRYSLSAIGGRPGQVNSQRAEKFGFLCELALKSPSHTRMASGALLKMFETAISLDQVKIYFNDYGECMGYVIWAYLTPSVEKRLLQGSNIGLHALEWNEGTSLWVIDFLVPYGSLKYVLRDMRDVLFRDDEVLTYFRVQKGRRSTKRLSRRSASSFFK